MPLIVFWNRTDLADRRVRTQLARCARVWFGILSCVFVLIRVFCVRPVGVGIGCSGMFFGVKLVQVAIGLSGVVVVVLLVAAAAEGAVL